MRTTTKPYCDPAHLNFACLTSPDNTLEVKIHREKCSRASIRRVRVFGVFGSVGRHLALTLIVWSCSVLGVFGAEVPLVKNGKPVAVVVEDIPEGAEQNEVDGIRKAAELLRFAVRRATGAELPSASAEGGLPKATPAVVLVGGGRLTKQAGLLQENLQAEEYRVVTNPAGSVAALYGSREREASRFRGSLPWLPTSYFAVAEVIESQWHGLWLWPGPDGFTIPGSKSAGIQPVQGTLRPKLAGRSFALSGLEKNPRSRSYEEKGLTRPPRLVSPEAWARVVEETQGWLRFHRMGSRTPSYKTHAFSDWLEKYEKTKPGLFAQPPPGQALPPNLKTRVKLRTSNPEVVRTIVEEWKAAGKPAAWSMGPNDGAFFDTSPETMALDEPPNQDPMAVWNSDGKLSARYARFYRDISHAMAEAGGKDVTLFGLAYSCYRDAPPNPEEFTMQTPVVLTFTHGFDDYAKEQWAGWRKTGAKLILRPNWFQHVGNAPNLPTREFVDWINWAADHGAEAFYIDGLLGHWGTQGLNYYALARVGENPGMSFDAILDEYCSAFGAAANPVKRYFQYWMDYTKKTDYPTTAGGAYGGTQGLYAKAVAEHGIPSNPLSGGHWATIYLYPDSVIEPARAILEEAAKSAATEEERRRVAFLRDGLEHFVLTRDTGLAGVAAANESTPEAKEHFNALSKKLKDWRAKLTPRHVVWGDFLTALERERRSPASGFNRKQPPKKDLDAGT